MFSPVRVGENVYPLDWLDTHIVFGESNHQLADRFCDQIFELVRKQEVYVCNYNREFEGEDGNGISETFIDIPNPNRLLILTDKQIVEKVSAIRTLDDTEVDSAVNLIVDAMRALSRFYKKNPMMLAHHIAVRNPYQIELGDYPAFIITLYEDARPSIQI